jgi:hypothetical protein
VAGAADTSAWCLRARWFARWLRCTRDTSRVARRGEAGRTAGAAAAAPAAITCGDAPPRASSRHHHASIAAAAVSAASSA